MRTTFVPTPTSICRLGLGRVDITPPVGIYHRFWGAAKHDRATGVHRPLTATVLTVQPAGATGLDDLHVLVAVDHCLLRPHEMSELLKQTSALIGVGEDRLTFLFSHTHSGGNLARGRSDLPGGDLIGPYLDSLAEKVQQAFQDAVRSQRRVTFSYAAAPCRMGHNRDYLDPVQGTFVCGFNPDTEMDLAVSVVRVSGEDGELFATIVSYPCHPTTLAWDNTLLSPDYVGAVREMVETATGAPCVFLLGACGDVGPRHGFVGDVAVADRNGRQVAHAALAAWESLPPVATDYHYAGPVLSGATLGVWEHRPLTAERRSQAAEFRHRRWAVPLKYRRDLPAVADAQRELQDLLHRESSARDAGDPQLAQEFRVLAERQRRLLERIQPLPNGCRYPYDVQVWKLGDAFWIGVEGEPYHALQQRLQDQFPANPLLVLPLANGARASYLPTVAAYQHALYQVDIALLAPGSLEVVRDAIAAQIASWLNVAITAPRDEPLSLDNQPRKARHAER